MFTGVETTPETVKISILDRHTAHGDNIILTRNAVGDD